jgi:tetratricopeptide (TPR) repeat protein
MPSRRLWQVALAIGISAFVWTAASADAAPSKRTTLQRGTKVLPKRDAVVKAGDKSIPHDSVPWIVQDMKDEWLLVGGASKGWVQRGQVVALDKAEEYYAQFIKKKQDLAWAYNLRGWARAENGDLDGAIGDFTEALGLQPEPNVYNNRGFVQVEKKAYDKALEDYNQAILLAPDCALLYVNRGKAHAAKSDWDKAIVDYNKAIRLDPKFAAAYRNRGLVWKAKNEFGEALVEFADARQLDPTFVPAYDSAAWLYATCSDENFRDGMKAVALAEKACELSGWIGSNELTTLAAAYAARGDFDMAINWQQKAIDLKLHNVDFVKQVEEYKALYKKHQALRK